MPNSRGANAYKSYWENQASFMDQAPWNLQKIFQLTFSNDFEFKALKPLGIDRNWLINMSLENSKCTHSLKK